jgi:hypothetical protein
MSPLPWDPIRGAHWDMTQSCYVDDPLTRRPIDPPKDLHAEEALHVRNEEAKSAAQADAKRRQYYEQTFTEAVVWAESQAANRLEHEGAIHEKRGDQWVKV